MKLRELMAEFDGNGFVLDDAGNGCAGRTWIEWDDDAAAEHGDTPMHVYDDNDFVWDDNAPHNDVFWQVAQDVADRQRTDDHTVYASSIIVTGSGDNPYRYRIIF